MKNWYKSWTIWFNIALLVITTINELSQIIPLSPEFMGYVALVGNLLLRFKTTTGLSTDKTTQIN